MDTANGPASITIAGKSLAVVLPDFATREELVLAWVDASQEGGNQAALRRVAAAALGLCTSTGKRAKVDYGACRCDVLVYGGKVYSWLHDQKVELPDVLAGGVEIVTLCAEAAYPRASEVAAKADFTAPPAAD